MTSNQTMLTYSLERIKKDLEYKQREVQSLIDLAAKPDRTILMAPVTRWAFLQLLNTQPILDEATNLDYHSSMMDAPGKD